jgi:hypothetical protein
MTLKSQTEIAESIATDLADNNAGLISAADVRENMLDIVNNIIPIVASGDFTSTPFRKGTVRIAVVDGDQNSGKLLVESGVIFPIGGLQREAYPGAGSINHNNLNNLDIGDPHTQYISTSGIRPMVGNFGMGNSWINSSGNTGLTPTTFSNRGLRFSSVNSSAENIHIGSGIVTGSGTSFVFDTDNSKMSTAKGVAKAWINFNASGTPIIRSHYNITRLEKFEEGKFKVVFASGTFGDNNYIAIGSSNARSDGDEAADFDVNKVGIVTRSGDDSTELRSATFYVINDAGNYVDAAINELVVYGRGPNEGSGVYPTVIVY